MSRRDDLALLIDAIAVLGHELRNTPTSPFGEDLTRAQMNLLFALSRTDRATVRQLAVALGVTSAAVSQTLAPLERAGLVSGDTDPADGRSRILRLADAARAQVDRFQQARIDALSPRFDPLSNAEIAATSRALTAIIRKAP